MERTKKPKKLSIEPGNHLGKPSAIFTGDWHLRETCPISREEVEFEAAQWTKVAFVASLQDDYDIPVIHSGDLFDYWKPSPALLSKCLKRLPNKFHTIYGNHDLPQHNLDLADKSGVYTLAMAGAIKILDGCHWGNTPNKNDGFWIEDKELLIWHTMTYQGKEPWPGCPDKPARSLLRKYDQFDVILTGHNHKAFLAMDGDRLLVNPGSLMRQNSDQIDFRPRVYLYYAESNTVEPILIPIESGVVSEEHIKNKKDRDNRIEAFVSRLDMEWKMGLDFEGNLEKFFSKNETRKSVINIVNKAIDN